MHGRPHIIYMHVYAVRNIGKGFNMADFLGATKLPN